MSATDLPTKSGDCNTPTGVVVRSLAASQAGEALALLRRTIEEINSRDYDPQQVARIQQSYTEKILQQGTTIVAERETKLVGVAVVALWRPTATISAVFVDPDCLRQGIGRALVVEIERRALSYGVKELFVAASLTAVGFYTALGYEDRGKMEVLRDVPARACRKRLLPLTWRDRVAGWCWAMVLGIVALGLLCVLVAILVAVVRVALGI